MSSPEKHVPKHRAPGAHKLRRARPAFLRPVALMSGAAATATVAAVSAGVLGSVSGAPALVAADASPNQSQPGQGQHAQAAEVAQSRVADRGTVSRTDRRDRRDPVKKVVLSQASGLVTTRTEDISEGDPREIGRALLGEYGFADSEFICLDSLYVSESNWRVNADNPTSSAYGIPQALTSTHDLPEGYLTSAEVQIRWGLDYIASRYGTPCQAWNFKYSHGWY